jgi:hypothetical protein
MTHLQSFMKTLLNNYEGAAPPELVSDNARLLVLSSCQALVGCYNTATFAINNEAITQEGEDDIRLTRWVSTNKSQSLTSGTGVRGGHHVFSSYLSHASPQKRESAPIPKTQLAALLASRNPSSTSRPRIYRHASLPPICPRRRQSFETATAAALFADARLLEIEDEDELPQ